MARREYSCAGDCSRYNATKTRERQMTRWMLCTVMMLLTSCTSSASRSVNAAAKPRAGEKPNIIFILSDDVGLGNIASCGGDTFKTPNIDALAAGGTRFARCYSTPLCGPSRAQILTGRYPFRTGMISNSSGGVVKPANEI